MKKLLSVFVCSLLLVVSSVRAEESESFSFKAVGFANPLGGSGGEVIRVTNLDAEGTGSLRAALETKGPRIVVFEVGGVIDLEKKPLVIREPFVTIAGQTAPSPGITLIRGHFSIQTHDVLVQHIRVRPGDAGEPKQSGWEPDGISTSGGDAYNITIDHCSITWATDENLSASGPQNKGPDATSHNVTFSNCIIAECLSNATHIKGEHSKGSLIHNFCKDIAVIGNLYAHNMSRNPCFKANTTGVIVNNVIYNPGLAAIQLHYSDAESKESTFKPEICQVSIVGNILIHGTNTKEGLALVASRGDAYLEDNQAFDTDGKPVAIVSGNITILKEKPVWPEGLNSLAAKDVVDYIVHHAGARPKDRDETDKRIIREFQERKGRIIDSQEDVGGYPNYKMTTRQLSIPEDGIDAWLESFANDLE